ncbi:hypothetical protein diail_336 [Diaporthe ilicicola]|nr:hypothetical protein diail_336 [Diaporthe ilicicola]
MVAVVRLALVLLTGALIAQACTYCQCEFQNGSHCCVYYVLGEQPHSDIPAKHLRTDTLPRWHNRTSRSATLTASRPAQTPTAPTARVQRATRVASMSASPSSRRRAGHPAISSKEDLVA